MTIRLIFFDTIERTQFFQNYSFTFISRKNLKDLDAKIFHGNSSDSHHLFFPFLMQFRILHFFFTIYYNHTNTIARLFSGHNNRDTGESIQNFCLTMYLQSV